MTASSVWKCVSLSAVANTILSWMTAAFGMLAMMGRSRKMSSPDAGRGFYTTLGSFQRRIQSRFGNFLIAQADGRLFSSLIY